MADPFSKPIAVGGYQGFTSFEKGVGIFEIADCRMPNADFPFVFKSAIGNCKSEMTYHSEYGVPSDEISAEAL